MSALCHAAKYQQSSSAHLCCCDLHRSKVLVFLQAALTASCWRNAEMNKEQLKLHTHGSTSQFPLHEPGC